MATALLLSDDLLFASRIRGHVEALGHSLRVVRDAAALLATAPGLAPTCVLLDLQVLGPPHEATAALRALTPAPRLVGYGSHVDAPTLKRAREAGCDVVLPRSAFVEALTTSLDAWLA